MEKGIKNVERGWDKLKIQASKEREESKKNPRAGFLFQLQCMHGYPYFILNTSSFPLKVLTKFLFLILLNLHWGYKTQIKIIDNIAWASIHNVEPELVKGWGLFFFQRVPGKMSNHLWASLRKVKASLGPFLPQSCQWIVVTIKARLEIILNSGLEALDEAEAK